MRASVQASAWWRPVRLRAGLGLRRRGGATVVLISVIALSGGVVMAAVAGARRTDTAVRRLNDYRRAGNAVVQSPDPAVLDAVVHLPQVVDFGTASFLSLSLSPAGEPARVTPFVAANDRMFRTFERGFLVRGVNPSPADPFHVVVSEPFARHRRLRVGSRFDLYADSAAQAQAAASGGDFDQGPPAGPRFTVTVSGISRVPTDIRADAFDAIYLTPAFLSVYARGIGLTESEALGLWGPANQVVRLRHGNADFDAFAAAARRLVGPDGTVTGDASDATIATRAAQRSVHIQALALLAFGALALVTTLVIVGQMIARSVAVAGRDDATLRALGMTGGQLTAAVAAWCAAVAVPAALLGVAVAIALSPAFPIGLARAAEMAPGVAVDGADVVIGALLTVLFVVAAGTMAAWRVGVRRKTARAAPARSRAVEALRRLGLPASASVGVGLSVEPGGEGDRGAPVRSALVGGVMAVAGVVAAATFAASLGHLVGDPRRQGWNWDVLIGNGNLTGDWQDLAARVAANPGAGAVTGIVAIEPVTIRSKKVDLLAMVDVKGAVPPTVLEGAPPLGDTEIALGSSTLRSLGRHVGDVVRVEGEGGQAVDMRIAGRVVMPIGGGWFGPDLGRGAVMTAAGARRLSNSSPAPHLFAVRYPPGVGRSAELAGFRHEFPNLTDTGAVPQDIDNLRRVAWMPSALALLLVVVGGAATGHALVTSIRRRRKDLAVLKTLGFVRRQLGASVAWQATTFAAVALVAGIPTGIVVGRLGWSIVASATGTFSSPVISWLATAVAVPAALVTANALAAGPGWAAGTVQPARILRAE